MAGNSMCQMAKLIKLTLFPVTHFDLAIADDGDWNEITSKTSSKTTSKTTHKLES